MTDRIEPRRLWISEWPGRADRYQAKALRLREEARRMTEWEAQRQMFDIASQYERLAAGGILPALGKAGGAGLRLRC